MVQISVIVDCAVLSGSAADVVRDVTQGSRVPRVVLLHTRRGGAPFSMLLTPASTPSHRSAVHPGAHAVALAVPLSCLPGAQLRAAAELDETPLVRGSRAMLDSLSRDLPREMVSPGPLEDALIALMRSVIAEDPQASVHGLHDLPLGARVAAIIELQHTDPQLDVARIARDLHTSRRQLYRHAGGPGIAALLAQRRVETASDLLRGRPELTIAEVAARSGFTSAPHLRAQLARWVGETPTEYRRRHRAGEPG